MDESLRQFRAFQELNNLRRIVDSDVWEFVNEFERYYYRFTQEKMKLLDTVMGFMLLVSCSLSEAQFQLVMSSRPKISYENMKMYLKRIFGGKLKSVMPSEMKSEPVFFSEEPSPADVDSQCGDAAPKDVYYSQNRNSSNRFRGNTSRFRGFGRGRERSFPSQSSARRGNSGQ